VTRDWIREGDAIYARSFAIIRAESDLAGLDPVEERCAVRMIHACGMVDLMNDIRFSHGFAARAREALHAGAPVLCDSRMVAEGITRKRLPADNEIVCTLSATPVAGTTRSAAALEAWRPMLAGAVVAIGNAPTALFRLLEMIDEGSGIPAAIIGMPVGFVGAAESKDALLETTLPACVVRGRRGGSAMAVACVNALASDTE
jgi:precorrin-8X/cobalt-precorrin-8 methylmutase